MIRNEDYEVSAPPPSYDTATSMGKMGEMKRGLLRQATKTEDEQVISNILSTSYHRFFIIYYKEAILEAFSDKAVRRGFIKKVYGILTVQVLIRETITKFYQKESLVGSDCWYFAVLHVWYCAHGM